MAGTIRIPPMIRRILILLAFLLLAEPVFAQEPLQPYDASGRYRTGGIEAQVSGALGDGRDVLLSWGALVVGLTLLALWPWSLGLLLVGPWLGHATWHAYRDAVEWA